MITKYHRAGKDVDSNAWWLATCYHERQAEKLVNILNEYENTIMRLRKEIDELKAARQYHHESYCRKCHEQNKD
jgi:hypothetical protein